MKRKIICISVTMVTFINGAAAFAFSDTADSPYKSEIEFFENAGIAIEKEDGKFCPNDGLTRAEAAKFLHDTSYTQTTEGPVIDFSECEYFTDLTSGFWALKEINHLASMGVIAGFSDGSFRPDEPVTGTQLLTMCANITGYTAFADDNLDWKEKYSKICTEYGFLDGIDIDLNKNITREEAAKIIYNTVNLPIVSTTGIEKDVSGKYVAINEIMDGSNGKETVTLWIDKL